jgi:type IV fimbrial biogenesis protein FimT
MKNRPSQETSQLLERDQRGFTIIELMLTITVLAVLLGLAVPSFLETVRNNRLISQNNEFIGALNFTRSEAVKRSNPVSMCASADNVTCTGSTDWGTGWIIFEDLDANGDAGATEPVLQVAPAIQNEFTLVATNRAFVRFGSSGMTSGAEIFSLLRPTCVGLRARRIDVSLVGRVSTTTVACP